MSDLDAILDGLREGATRPDDRSITRFDPFVSLADAESAVREARDATVKEIVEEIRDGITMIADNEFEEGANAALESALGLIARRFPNGGTHDG